MQKACKKCGQVSEIEEITPETACPTCGAYFVKTDALIAEGAPIRTLYVTADALIAEEAAIRSEQPLPRFLRWRKASHHCLLQAIDNNLHRFIYIPMRRSRKPSPVPVKHERKRYPLSRMVVKTYQLLIEVFLWIWIIFAAIFGYFLGVKIYRVVAGLDYLIDPEIYSIAAGIFGSLAGLLIGFVLAALFSGIIFVLTDMRQSLEEIKNRIGE